MYRRAQTWIYLLLCSAVTSVSFTSQEDVTTEGLQCLLECICLSPTQVLCNTGGLQDIPTRQLPTTVEELSLTKNNFSVIRMEAFNGLKALRKLNLDGNTISLIKPFAFRGLNKLTELSIQHTSLPFIGQFSFAALQNVTVLLLANNKIGYIEENSFAGTSNIKLILLSNNPLITIRGNAFSGLSNVEHLILPSGIRIVEADSFHGLQNVGMLKMTYMDLDSLRPNTFNGLSHVHELNVQDSDLAVVRKDAFNGLSHVDNINIMNNKIDAIEQLHIYSNSAIGMFRFHGNHVLEAPRPGDAVLEVGTISAVENYFPCDCQIHDVLESDFANSSVVEFQQRNFCISPLEYNGKPMNTVDFDVIARCHEKVVHDNLGSRSSTLAGSQLVLAILLLPLV
ncbi:insulin-like growth factor-binding protein complex acid labile subunit [Orussus abietinus]|uniref:insulin-like growth factor-binding protein complex acid labile subunit n=1 Tax=Orussus abietinus TaxID=222816 RepID=UPI000626418E|nr:insulin-like growth factor-binding protein complex acid labile subunit [Orussus abietinus]